MNQVFYMKARTGGLLLVQIANRKSSLSRMHPFNRDFPRPYLSAKTALLLLLLLSLLLRTRMRMRILCQLTLKRATPLQPL